MRLVQLRNGRERRVAIVEEPQLRLLDGVSSLYVLAEAAIRDCAKLADLARKAAGTTLLLYDEIYSGKAQWKLMVPIDHPEEPARCLVSGTGLTHLGSAKNRQSMHEIAEAELTDSMKMFQWGIERGRPAADGIGIAPEWFHKGTGSALRAHNEPLEIPTHAEDGGEEAEIAGIYIVGADGEPRRIGFAGGNEFSDHQFEKKNYLNLAGSKLRQCSLGPELLLDTVFESVNVDVAIVRDGKTLWSKSFLSGERGMCHSLQNLEHHHFKFETHRRPGDIHVHFFGTAALSFSDGIQLSDGDVMRASFEGFGRPLINPVRTIIGPQKLVRATPLG
jgi:hypothetical protein